MPEPSTLCAALRPLVIPCGGADLDDLLGREWLISNRIGAYASSTVVGCNTRRYHGLLVAATAPPMGRWATLATVSERLTVGGQSFDLGTNEFPRVFSPRGFEHLVEFRNDAAPSFAYRLGDVELVKEIVLADSANAVAIRYTVRGAPAALEVRPFLAGRDFHHLRSAAAPKQMTFDLVPGGVRVENRAAPGHPLYLVGKDGGPPAARPDGGEAGFDAGPQWWYNFRYRADIARGQDGSEDLYTPGTFHFELADGASCQLTASQVEPLPLGFETTLRRRRERLAGLAEALGPRADQTARRLAGATDAFVVRRLSAKADSATILAGFHWFADWGRDAFIALPGLLLGTRRFDLARQVFRTFADRIADGMIPGRFDDYSEAAHYNSIDASLWFIVAGERYLAATGDTHFWRNTLLPPAETILQAYRDGTRFDIRADADGLLTGGSQRTQLTWMDAALGEEVITPRHGKAVEINALWHSAHRILAERLAETDRPAAGQYAEWADLIGLAFDRAFWNPGAGCLYDCIRGEQPDASIRPNQILAVSLPYSPLTHERQASVVRVVASQLLTPMGLRTLSPRDGRYRGRYGGSWESRDRAYHQGTVWAWLIGPFIEAYLKVEQNSPPAVEQCRQWLSAFDEHLQQAGIGYISEIFDGDPPHEPRGCIAQAWSVGEVLRAKLLVERAADP